MLYSKNITNIVLLQAELRKLKASYVEALKNKKENLHTFQQLRKRIKLLTSRIDIINSYALGTGNSKNKVGDFSTELISL